MLLKDLFKTFDLEPFAPFGSFGRDVDRLLSGFTSAAANRYPAVNVAVGPGSIDVTAEIAGVDPGEIDVSIEGNTLTLRGELKAKALDEDALVHRRERPHGKFVRALELPVSVDPKKASASFEHGILQISLPKADEAVPRKIKVS